MQWTASTIAIVGPDGAGKTTQAQLLTEHLQAAGYDAQYVHALYYLSDCIPYADRLRSRLGPRKTRTQLRTSSSPAYRVRQALFSWVSYWFALLTIGFVSVRFRNQVVVFDRYYHQFFYDVYGSAGISLSRMLPQPGQIIHLDAEPDTLQTRLGAVEQAVDEQYYTTVISLYQSCATDDWLTLRAELPIATLHEQIVKAVCPPPQSGSIGTTPLQATYQPE